MPIWCASRQPDDRCCTSCEPQEQATDGIEATECVAAERFSFAMRTLEACAAAEVLHIAACEH